MKYICAALFFASGMAAAQPAPCSTSIKDARARAPLLADLPDDSFVRALREVYYPELTDEQVASALCVTLPPPWSPRGLNMLDRWRYDRCQRDAANAPTERGVNIGMRLCREKFGQ